MKGVLSLGLGLGKTLLYTPIPYGSGNKPGEADDLDNPGADQADHHRTDDAMALGVEPDSGQGDNGEQTNRPGPCAFVNDEAGLCIRRRSVLSFRADRQQEGQVLGRQ